MHQSYSSNVETQNAVQATPRATSVVRAEAPAAPAPAYDPIVYLTVPC